MKFFITLIIIMSIVSVGYAKTNKHYINGQYNQYNYDVSKNYYTHNRMIYLDDQYRCQAKANYMAANKISGHIWQTIGNFEGVGFGYSPNCNTCIPSGNLRLTGDASAQDSNGRWYRVRSWR